MMRFIHRLRRRSSVPKHIRWADGSVALALSLVTALAYPTGAAGPAAKPEDVGLSTERLRHIHELMQRHLDAKNFSGAVTLVGRNGRVAHLEAHGLMDLESKKPMRSEER